MTAPGSGQVPPIAVPLAVDLTKDEVNEETTAADAEADPERDSDGVPVGRADAEEDRRASGG